MTRKTHQTYNVKFSNKQNNDHTWKGVVVVGTKVVPLCSVDEARVSVMEVLPEWMVENPGGGGGRSPEVF